VDSSRPAIAIFVPLYLDSAFDATGTYRYDKNFPKFINPGLEFYEGAQMALDTLAKEHVKLDVRIYRYPCRGNSFATAIGQRHRAGR